MKEFLEIVSEEMKQAFEKAGYPAEYGKVNVSNRPDLCEPVSYTHLTLPTIA